MSYIYNDGGRKAAGFKGTCGDCVARSIAIITGLNYKDVYAKLAEGNASQRITKKSSKASAGVKTARSGINTNRKWFKDYMRSLGFEWVTVKGWSEEGLYPSELGGAGRIIAKQRRHYVAVIDGVVYDIFDSSDKIVYGYWVIK